MNYYDKTLAKVNRRLHFVLNLFLVKVNQVTGGNYGLLNTAPFISDVLYGSSIFSFNRPFFGFSSLWYLVWNVGKNEIETINL